VVGEDQDRIDELEAAAKMDREEIDSLNEAARRSRDRIDALEAAALVREDVIRALEAAVIDADAAAVVSDARILDLAAEVEGLTAAMEHRSVIEQAKGVLMSTMRISPDAAFAVLVAASQRENVKLYTIAERLAAAQDEHPAGGEQ
jgi:hypothetical protein